MDFLLVWSFDTRNKYIYQTVLMEIVRTNKTTNFVFCNTNAKIKIKKDFCVESYRTSHFRQKNKLTILGSKTPAYMYNVHR